MIKKQLLSILLLASTSLNAALVAHYTFDDIITDSQNNYDLAVAGGGVEGYTTGIYNNAYTFNSVDNFLELANADSFPTSNSGTVSFWLKSSGSAGALQSFVKMSDRTIEVRADDNSLETFDGKVLPNGNENGRYDIINTPNIYNSSWHLVTVTFSNVNGSEKIYIDGILRAVDVDENGHLEIGDHLIVGGQVKVTHTFGPFTVDTTKESRYLGAMDDLRIYDHELTALEVQALLPVTMSVSVPISKTLYLFFIIMILFVGMKQSKQLISKSINRF